ncbi:MAG: InlB B-repeat-containing protein [Lachnospiraceae bacterium]|nr:InlB B-repeat-containing protein [Lachnospiraceae bacterium]
MKRKAMFGVLMAMSLSSMVAFTGCGPTKEAATEVETEVAGETVAADSETEGHTITLYDMDGTTVLDTVTVADGETLSVEDPTKDGYTFMGWYISAERNRQYDATKAVTGDMDLYAGFASYQEDTRSFYLVGAGESEVLAESNWGAVVGEAQQLVKSDNAEANEYSITLELAEGDQFQIATNASWEDQRGYGYLASDNMDGTFYFKCASGLGDADPKKSNIEVVKAGTYTLTLTTYPAEDVYDTENEYYTEETKENFNMNPYDSITWTYEAQ